VGSFCDFYRIREYCEGEHNTIWSTTTQDFNEDYTVTYILELQDRFTCIAIKTPLQLVLNNASKQNIIW